MVKKQTTLLVVLTITLATIATTVSAQSKKQKEVSDAVNQLTQAMLKADGQALNKLAAEELSYVHSSGKVETKKDFVQTFVPGASVFEEIQITDQDIQVVDKTAVVRHILHAKTNDPGKGPAQIKIGIMLTWVKTKSGWQLLGRQAYKLP